MTMLGVVPGKECLAVSPGILDAAEAIREVRTIFKRLEVRFGDGIVIGNIRPTMSLDDFQIDQQGSDVLGALNRWSVCALSGMKSTCFYPTTRRWVTLARSCTVRTAASRPDMTRAAMER
jgi:hypothetical protein